MITPPKLDNEVNRIKALNRLNILDTEQEERFDRLTRLTAQLLECESVGISFIDADRQWFKSTVNMTVSNLPRQTAFCAYTIALPQYLSVPDTLKDKRFANHPLVLNEPTFRFYAGVNIVVEGQPVGTLCVYDKYPKTLSSTQISQLMDLGKIVEAECQRETNVHLLEAVKQYQVKVKETQKLVRVRSAILEKIIASTSLDSVLKDIVSAIEKEYEGQKCSILLLEGNKLVMGAAPSLPDFYNNAINGVEIGAGVGSCGNTAFTNSLTVVDDIPSHPYWNGWSQLAMKANLRSCWSQPIRGADNKVLGTFAIYQDVVSKPSRDALVLIEQFAHIASIAIERERANRLIWRQANFDVLTALPNRHLMEAQLKHLLSAAKRDKTKVAILFLDLDNFKDVNDTLGHDVGDMLLVECARRIEKCIGHEDIASRQGGDEFVILMGGITDVPGVNKTIQTLRKEISAPYFLQQQHIHTSVSIGVACYPNDGDDVITLLKNADQAMYSAKGQGKNNHQFYSQELHESALKRLSYKNDLRCALKNKEFHVEYQPIVDITTGKITKAEALLRWQHPERGLIGSDEFIPLAEESGAIIDISNWVFEQICDDALKWRAQFCSELQLSVNTSPRLYFHRQPNIMDWLSTMLKRGLSPKAILLEITENLLMDANPQVTNKLFQFRQSGVSIVLDDFGTGFSSISYLKKFPTDYIKIDRTFVRSMAEVGQDKVLCEAIIVMAKKLGIQVVAEGIETREQLDILRAMGCDYGQGYYFSKPLSKSDFEQVMAMQ